MIDKQMWYDWIKQQMEMVSGETLTKLSSEAYLMESEELDEALLPPNLDEKGFPSQLMVYMYGALNNAVLGYVLVSEELDVMYLAGVIVDGKLCWSQIGDELE